MRYFSFLQVLSLAIMAVMGALAGVPEHKPDPPPLFNAIFAGQLLNAPYTNTTGPFGLRVHAPLSG